MSARVLLRGERARIETLAGQQTVVVLWIKPYLYRLLPATKTGVRSQTNGPAPELQGPLSNWPQLLSNPSRIRKALTDNGARKVGNATLNGVATEVYAAKNWKSTGTPAGSAKMQDFRIWLRRADSLPVKMESGSGDLKVVMTWNNYHRNPNLSPALFQVPQGYRIREAQVG